MQSHHGYMSVIPYLCYMIGPCAPCHIKRHDHTLHKRLFWDDSEPLTTGVCNFLATELLVTIGCNGKQSRNFLKLIQVKTFKVIAALKPNAGYFLYKFSSVLEFYENYL